MIDTSMETCKVSRNLLESEIDSLKVGDIFREEYYPGNPTKAKTWHVHIPPADFVPRCLSKISIRHSPLTGKWVLIVNGAIKGAGYENPVKIRKFEIDFVLEDNRHSKIVSDGSNSIGYKYSLYIDKVLINKEDAMPHRSMVEKLPILVSIPDTRNYTLTDSDSKPITLYQLHVQLPNDQSILLEKRYSELAMFDTIFRSYLDNALLADLPAFPNKIHTPFFGQKVEVFIESRRSTLETYLRFLLGNKKVRILI
jgi:hypothetical protein